MAKAKGFTLIEMLLVLVIVSALVVASIGYINQRTAQMRVDRTTLQMQEILNAGMSFYVAQGNWPTSIAQLQTPNVPYLPLNIVSPFGGAYTVSTDPTNAVFYVSTTIAFFTAKDTFATATVISGTLPLAYTSSTAGTPPANDSSCTVSSTSCFVVAGVNIPGQNLNNARAINFAGIYHHGACVPVPICPVDINGNPMTAQILVAPVQVSGTNDVNAPPAAPNVYPIESFTAYATAPANSPAVCTGDAGPAVACTNGSPITTPVYWRVCMNVVTEKGQVSSTSTDWGAYQSMIAMTRCVVSGEPAGTPFGVTAGTNYEN